MYGKLGWLEEITILEAEKGEFVCKRNRNSVKIFVFLSKPKINHLNFRAPKHIFWKIPPIFKHCSGPFKNLILKLSHSIFRFGFKINEAKKDVSNRFYGKN